MKRAYEAVRRGTLSLLGRSSVPVAASTLKRASDAAAAPSMITSTIEEDHRNRVALKASMDGLKPAGRSVSSTDVQELLARLRSEKPLSGDSPTAEQVHLMANRLFLASDHLPLQQAQAVELWKVSGLNCLLKE